MNNIHILADFNYFCGSLDVSMNKLLCGLLYRSGASTLHKIVKINRFHKGKFIAEGEAIQGVKEEILMDFDRCTLLQPVVLYSLASGSVRDYCDLCRYEFYKMGGMLLSDGIFKSIFGKDFYPEVIRKRDLETDG